jgi:hypoxanthine phosphoribosyltransferase
MNDLVCETYSKTVDIEEIVNTDGKDISISPQKAESVFSKSKLLISAEDLHKSFDRMSLEIINTLADKNPVIICIMNGGLMFTAELMRRISFPLEFDYVHASRYGNATKPGENLRWKKYPSRDLDKRCVLLLDDVLDGGVTFAKIKEYCLGLGASEVYTAVMVDKKVGRDPLGVKQADFTGVEVGNDYIFGFGLDYHGYLRNKDGIFAIDEKDL